LRAVAAPHLLSLADQGVVNGAQFLTTVAVARYTSASELGAYSIACSLLLSAIAVQESLISLPYMIQRHSPIGTPAENAGCSLVQSLLLAISTAIAFCVAALALSASGARPAVAAVTWTLAVVMPFRLLREFGRQFAFAHLRMTRALLLDIAIAVIQLGAMSLLALTGRMSAVTTLLALGAAYAPAGVVGVWLDRSNLAIRLDRLQPTIRQSWGLGRWLFAGQMTVWTQVSVANWALALIIDTKTVGVYAACISVVQFASPFISSFCNTLTPKAVTAFRDGGGAGLRRHAIQSALLLGAGLGLFCAAIAFFGEDVMRLLYRNGEYWGQGDIVTVLGLALLASSVGIPASNALASMQRPCAIVLVGSISAVFTVVLVTGLTIRWGLVGAAFGFLGGNFAGASGRWAAFLLTVSQSCKEKVRAATSSTIDQDPNVSSVIRVVEKLTRSSNGSWELTKLGEASEASVYSVRAQHQQSIWNGHHTLVVKLYKQGSKQDTGIVHAQYDALSRLHLTMHGRASHGWKISVPEPIYICKSPVALVMTQVPGQTLTLCLETGDDMTPEVLDSAARAIVTAMELNWSLGRLHGDLGFDNILCDVSARNLSFVDPDATRGCSVSAASDPQNARVREMGAFLTDMELNGDRSVQHRKRILFEGMLRALFENIPASEDGDRLLHQIDAFARAHLQVRGSLWSARRWWRFLLGRIVARRVDRLLARFRVEFCGPRRRPLKPMDHALLGTATFQPPESAPARSSPAASI
jgi:O-antigen/teichoic acid export membrane protein